jgi:hypothetical protein
MNLYRNISGPPSNSSIFAATTAAISDSKPHKREYCAHYRWLVIAFLFLNTVSSLLFIYFVRRPVFDDPNYMPDVHRYATEGISVDTIRSQIAAPGPTSFVWMASGVHLLGGDELRAARLSCLAGWLTIGGIVLLGAPYTRFPEAWYASLLFTLVMPHTLTATATIRAEGPAMALALGGALAWLSSISRPAVTPKLIPVGILGGLAIGLAIDGRQYYLALLAAACVFAMLEWHERGFEIKSLWFVNAFVSLLVACFPVLLLMLVWKGLSSPGMVTGSSYGTWVSKVGLNLFRPVLAVFYIAVYLFPLSFPAMFCLSPPKRWRSVVFASLCGISAAIFASHLLQPGPLNTLIGFVGREAVSKRVLLGFITAVATYNSIGLGWLIWLKREVIKSNASVVLALLVIAFFVGEQVGIGGNLPFYEIYVLQIVPFMGLVVFAALPALTRPRVMALVFLSIVSQMLLWRHAS